MPRPRRLLPLAILAPLAGFALTGCANLHDLRYETTQKKRACDAWQCYAAENCSTKFSKDYKLGYKAGYYDVLTGGGGCPPIVAPKCYWDPKTILKHCDERRNEWYRGWQDGAAHAKATPDTHYLKLFMPPCCPPQHAAANPLPPHADAIYPPADLDAIEPVEDVRPPADETPLPDLNPEDDPESDEGAEVAPAPDEDDAKERVDELMEEAEKLRLRKPDTPAKPAKEPYFPVPPAGPDAESDTPLPEAKPVTEVDGVSSTDRFIKPLGETQFAEPKSLVETFDFGTALGALSSWEDHAARTTEAVAEPPADAVVEPVFAPAAVAPAVNPPSRTSEAVVPHVTPVKFEAVKADAADPLSGVFEQGGDSDTHPADERYFNGRDGRQAPSASTPLAVPLFGHELRAKFKGTFRGAVKPVVAATAAGGTRKVPPTQTAAR